jgi:hypothetical protein
MKVVFLEPSPPRAARKPRVHPAGLKASGDGGRGGRLRILVRQPERAG